MKHPNMLAAFVAATVLSSSAYARDSLIVQASPSVARWTAEISHSLDHNLRYPHTFGGQVPEGVVTVAFDCSDAGLPSQVTVVSPSRFASLDREAVRAIRRLKSMHPLPLGVSDGQRFEAEVFFADSENSLHRMQTAARQRQQLASRDPTILKLAVHAAR